MKCPKLKTYTVTIQVTVKAVNEEHALLEAHLALLTSMDTSYYEGMVFTRHQDWELNVGHQTL